MESERFMDPILLWKSDTFFATWIEAQPWNSINEDDERQKDVAQKHTDTLLRLMKSKIEELQSGQDDTFLLRLRLEEIAQGFEKRYSKDPLGLVRVIKACLKKERMILEEGIGAGIAVASSHIPNGGTLDEKTINDLAAMNKQIENAEVQLKALQQQQEFFVIQYQELCKLQAALTNQKDTGSPPSGANAALTPEQKKRQELKNKKIQLERLLSEEGSKILQTRQMLGSFYQECLNTLNIIQDNFIEDKLEKWKALQCLGMLSEDEQASQLDALQLVCERLAENLWMIRQQIRQLNALQEQLFLKPDEPDTTLPLNTRLMNQSTHLLRLLIQSSFVLEKQPPQVLKTQTKFTTTARLLIGGKLNVYLSPPEVKASIISQQQARSLTSWHNDLLINVPQAPQMLDSLANITGTLLNDKKVFEYYKETSSLKAAFKNLSLKKIKRRDTKSDEVVTEEKFGLVMHCFVTVGDMNFCVYALSNPLVVIVHGNQYANAVATILWDNFFREKNREPFNVPEAVPWVMAAEALNNHFTIINSVSLRPGDLDFLKNKIGQEETLSWSYFNRETIPQRTFTFWEWFYGIEEVVRKHAHQQWCDGLIAGFITKKDAETLLIHKNVGTFLLRFSDSEIGGISVAWVGEDTRNNDAQHNAGGSSSNTPAVSTLGVKKVWHLQPWFSKDLMIRSLPDRLSDLVQLTTLYPNIPKDAAFSKYYSQKAHSSSSSLDYVRTSIAATVLMENLSIQKRKADQTVVKDEQQEYQDWNQENEGSPHDGSDFLAGMSESDDDNPPPPPPKSTGKGAGSKRRKGN